MDEVDISLSYTCVIYNTISKYRIVYPEDNIFDLIKSIPNMEEECQNYPDDNFYMLLMFIQNIEEFLPEKVEDFDNLPLDERDPIDVLNLINELCETMHQ